MNSIAFTVAVRFLHIASVSTLAGGSIIGGLVMHGFSNEQAARWRPLVTSAVLIAFLSGAYMLANKAVTPPGYHMWFGVKFVLALHVMAVSILAGRSSVTMEKRRRLLTGSAITSLFIILIAATLRWL